MILGYLVLWFFYNSKMFFVLVSLALYMGLAGPICLGGFLDYMNYPMIMMGFMTMQVMGLIYLTEKVRALEILAQFVVLISLLFFFSSSLMLMYIFYELSMVPIIFMILGYGSQVEKIGAAYYLIFYVSLCSAPFLFVYYSAGYYELSPFSSIQLAWPYALMLSLVFMVKLPVYFFHIWLLKAHVEAPTTASIVLASILLKLGGVGLVRIMKTLSFVHLNLFMMLAFMGMVLSAIGCMFQSDMKGLIAQSSVAHMGFVFMGTNLMSVAGKTSAFVVMLGHGYASALMFYYAGVLSHAVGTRMLYYLNSLMKTSVSLSLSFSTVMLANSGAPLSLTFFGEFIGFCGLLSQFKLAIIVLGLYFFFSFYSSVFLLTNTLMGKKSVQIEEWPACYSFGLLFMVFNFVVFELLV